MLEFFKLKQFLDWMLRQKKIKFVPLKFHKMPKEILFLKYKWSQRHHYFESNLKKANQKKKNGMLREKIKILKKPEYDIFSFIATSCPAFGRLNFLSISILLIWEIFYMSKRHDTQNCDRKSTLITLKEISNLKVCWMSKSYANVMLIDC